MQQRKNPAVSRTSRVSIRFTSAMTVSMTTIIAVQKVNVSMLDSGLSDAKVKRSAHVC